MLEQRKYELAAKWADFLKRADKERLLGFNGTAERYEESAAKVEAELQKDDADPRDYLE